MGLIAACVLLLCWSSSTNANRSPEITQDTYFTCEDVPIGQLAFAIQATDPDGDPITYSIGGVDASYFRVDQNSGSVFVEKQLDRETKGTMQLTATVSDRLNPGIPKPLFIIINDANDNRPIFENASYEATVPENTTVGTSLFKVTATDYDSGSAGTVIYTIDGSVPTSGQNTFRIDSKGNVILNEILNYNKISTFYRIKINASDKGGKCFEDVTKFLSSSVFAFITVKDLPDLDPQFIGIPYTASVDENTAIGKSVFTVSAFDPDTGVNDVIIYSILDSTSSNLFSIDENGVISVNGEIDREVIGDVVALTVQATETNPDINGVRASATAQVRITIIDINDNSPKFYKCPDPTNCVLESRFTGEVKEHTLGAISLNMTVKDADKSAETQLSLDGDGKDLFSVQPSVAFSDSVVQLTVQNLEDLDYETMQQVTLKVIAVDKGDSTLRATADVTITILDTNDHSPVFAENTYYAEVAEHCADGTVVETITAQDPDSMDQGKIRYSLLPESILTYFDIEPTTGRVFVKNGALLDREIRALYSVTIQARDSDGKPGSTVLEITVTDINDKAPVPNRPTYQEFVPEGGNLENVKIEATDGDEPDTPNSQLVFAIEPGPYSTNFTINPETGVLTNNGPLDREDINPALDGRIELNVKISDKGSPPLSSIVQVIINVQDVNDNKPEFGKPLYNFTVKEGVKGAFVGSVDAVDQDQTSEFNRISFSIVNGGFGSFMISSIAEKLGYTGQIKVDQDIELDYESSRKSYSLQVEATDLQLEKAEVTVEVHVLDVNDERPEFRPIPPVAVEENTKETGAIGQFDAVDKDTNSSLVYEQVSVTCRCSGEEQPCDWFVVEPNGEVIVNPEATIDYESCKQAIVKAQVVDENTEKGESNSASPGEMVINIVDVNDNTPEFIYSSSVFVMVSETASKGTSVAAVSATDRDSGTNAQIDFKVTKVEFRDMNDVISDRRIVFEAITTQQKDIYVGIIQSTEKLNTQLKGKYLVTVEARDTGGLSNTTDLEIFVVDESYKNVLKFRAPVSEVKAKEEEIKRDLTVCTQAAVQVVAIKEEGTYSVKASEVTLMEVYFVYANGTALTASYVETELSKPSNYLLMSKYQLIYVGYVDPGEPKQGPEMYILFGIVGGLLIVTIVLTTSLFCTRRNYRRKLKAANAMKSASAAMSENQRGGAVVPGTNLYTMEGANPVLNLNIDADIALDLDEESDVDKVSLNSLDNSDVMTVTEKDTKPIMQKSRDEDKESGPPAYIEPLGAALAQRDQKIRSNNPLLGDANPVFDITDL